MDLITVPYGHDCPLSSQSLPGLLGTDVGSWLCLPESFLFTLLSVPKYLTICWRLGVPDAWCSEF